MSRTIAALVVVGITLFASISSTTTTTAAPQRKATVLLIGDSVTANIRFTREAQNILNRSRFSFTSETWICQALLRTSCNSQRTPSALNQVKKYRNSDVDIIVIGTGYNDSNDYDVRTAVRAISAEAQLQGAHLMWLTYHDGGFMQGRASKFNRVLRAEAKTNGMTLLNWAATAKGRTKWYTKDRVHMNRTGGIELAKFIRSGLTRHAASTTTTTTSTTTTTIAIDTSTSTSIVEQTTTTISSAIPAG